MNLVGSILDRIEGRKIKGAIRQKKRTDEDQVNAAERARIDDILSRKFPAKIEERDELTETQLALLNVAEQQAYGDIQKRLLEGFRQERGKLEDGFKLNLRALAELAKYLEQGGKRESFRQLKPNWYQNLPEGLIKS